MKNSALGSSPPSTINTSSMTLTFDDEFNSLSLYNPATGMGTWKTNYQYGRQSDWTSRTFAGNQEKEIYVDPTFRGAGSTALGINPFSIDDGTLSITARTTPSAMRAALWNYGYTSGVLTTEPSFSQTYGYFEVRAKLPAGQGVWPAFWLVPSDASAYPEIDVMEQIGGAGVYQSTHTKSSGSLTSKTYTSTVATDTSSYHTYGALWTPETVTFYIDGKETASEPTPSDMNKPMYMILNLAIGGSWPGNPSSSFASANYNIDYVRAYSLPVLAPTNLPDSVTTASSFTLGPGQHALTLIGAANATATGNDLGDHLTGNSGGDLLKGGAGADYIVSGSGLDTLVGGAGDDTYVVNNPSDTITETSNGGRDTVITGFTYVLPSNIEDLTLQYGGNAAAIGNSLDNVITGNSGANLIDGMAGADTLIGGLGNDTFRFEAHSGRDVVSDFDAHGEQDALDVSAYLRAGYHPTITDHGADTVISFTTGDSITLLGVHSSQLTLSSSGIIH